MDNIIDWLKQSSLADGNPNWALLVVALIIAINAIVAWTKTPDDDATFKKAIQYLSILAPKDAPKVFKWLFTAITRSQLEQQASDKPSEQNQEPKK